MQIVFLCVCFCYKLYIFIKFVINNTKNYYEVRSKRNYVCIKYISMLYNLDNIMLGFCYYLLTINHCNINVIYRIKRENRTLISCVSNWNNTHFNRVQHTIQMNNSIRWAQTQRISPNIHFNCQMCAQFEIW